MSYSDSKKKPPLVPNSYKKNVEDDLEPYELIQPESPSFDQQQQDTDQYISFNDNIKITQKYVYEQQQNPENQNQSLNNSGISQQQYIKLLSEKVRKQAENIIELENYKHICETRIVQLCPDHTLPVNKSHLIQNLGSSAKKKTDTGSKDKIQNQTDQGRFSFEGPQSASKYLENITREEMSYSYQELTGKFNKIQQEKQELEESLKKEILLNEEQRTYIQILKQISEGKLESMGFPTIGNKQRIDFISEIKQIMEKSRNLQNQNINQQQIIQDLERDIIITKEDNDRLNQKNIEQQIYIEEHLKEIQKIKQENISHLEDIKRLEQEKISLLEYIEDQTLNVDNLKNEINEGQKLLQNIQSELNEQNLLYTQGQSHIIQLQLQLDKAHQQLQNNPNLESQLHQTQLNFQTQTDKIQSLEIQNQTLKETNLFLEKLQNTKDNRLKEDYDELTQKYKELVQENEKYREKFKLLDDSLSKQHVSLTSEIRNQQKMIQELKEKLQREEKYKQENQKTVENQQKFKTKQEKDNINLLENEINEQKQLQELLIDKNESLEQRVQQLEKIIEDNENQMKNLEGIQSNQQTAIYTNQNDYQSLIYQNKQLTKEINEQNLEREQLENIIQESKERAEKDREKKMNEIRKLIEENNKLKNENIELRELIKAVESNLLAKNEETNGLKELIDRKNEQYKNIIEENRNLRILTEEGKLLKAKLQAVKIENENNIAESNNLQQIVQVKAEQTNDLGNKLIETDNILKNLEKNHEKLQEKQNEIEIENKNLIKRVEILENENNLLRDILNEKDEKILNINATNDRYSRQLSVLAKDIEEITLENRNLSNQVTSMKNRENTINKQSIQLEDILKELFSELKQFVQDFNKFQNGLILESPLSDKLLSLVSKFEVYPDILQDLMTKENLDEGYRFITEWIKMLLSEFIKSLREINDVRQDLKISRQRIATLEKKNIFLGSEETTLKVRERDLKNEIDNLLVDKVQTYKEKSDIYKREEKIEKELIQLRNENKNLLMDVEQLRSKNNQLTIQHKKYNAELKNDQKLQNSQLDITHTQNLKDKLNAISREKKALEDVIERLTNLIPNSDIKRTIQEYLRVQKEIDLTEREKTNLETNLTSLEADYKSLLKKYHDQPTTGFNTRKEIENLREKFNNCNTQIIMLKKRKDVLVEELKSFEILEQRRYDLGIQTERNYLMTRNQLQEQKLQNDNLIYLNQDLKNTLKSVNNENKYLDQENTQIRFMSNPLSKIQEKDNENLSQRIFFEQKSTLNRGQTNNKIDDPRLYSFRKERDSENIYQQTKSLTAEKSGTNIHKRDFSDTLQHGQYDQYGLYQDNYAEEEQLYNQTTSSNNLNKKLEQEALVVQKMRLKERLDKAKNLLNSGKKIDQYL